VRLVSVEAGTKPMTLEDLAAIAEAWPQCGKVRGYRCNRKTFEELRAQCVEVRDAGDLPPRFTGCTIEIDDWMPDGAFLPIIPETPMSYPKPPETAR
jgi:hypothetical protein